MKKIPLLIKTFLIFFIFNVIPLPINAQNSHQNAWPMATFLYDYAKVLYERGDFLNARHEFNTLLVIDPNNAMAKHYLKKMSPVKELPQVSERRRPEAEPGIRPEAGLREENRWLRAAVSQFREEIVDKSMRIASLKKEREEGAEGDAASREKQIDQALSDAERYVCRINEYAQEIRGRQQAFRAALQEKEIEAAEKDRQLDSLREHLRRLEDENLDKNRQIAQLQAFKDLEIADFKARAAEVRDLLQAQEMEIAALNRELELQQQGMDKRLLERELELAAKYTEIEKLNIRLDETNLQLAQAEKDKLDNQLWIEQLHNTVKQLEGASSDQLAKYLKKLNSLEDSLKAKETELARSSRDFDSRSQELQGQLSAKSSEAEKLNSKINGCQKKLVILENSLKVKARELAELKKKFDLRR